MEAGVAQVEISAWLLHILRTIGFQADHFSAFFKPGNRRLILRERRGRGGGIKTGQGLSGLLQNNKQANYLERSDLVRVIFLSFLG